MSRVAIINGRVFSPKLGTIETQNMVFVNGMLAGYGYLPDDDPTVSADSDSAENAASVTASEPVTVYDLNGALIVPNVTDAVAVIDQGGETLVSASRAAIENGITSMLFHPRHYPYRDNPDAISFVKSKVSELTTMDLHPVGLITKEGAGEQLAEMGLMHEAGAVGFSDPVSIDNTALMRNALSYSSQWNAPLIVRPMEPYLCEDAVMHDGPYSTRLGLKGAPSVAEEIRLSRDLKLLEHYGGKLVVFPVSTRGSVELIRRAKEKGLAVYAGTAPHYLWFHDADLIAYDTNKKVWPPFRTQTDSQALLEGIQDGTIDFFASDHTPLGVDKKRADFCMASPGISALDSFLPSILTKCFHEHGIALETLLKLVSSNVHTVFGLKPDPIGLAKSPSFTVLSVQSDRVVDADSMVSVAKNSPFIGRPLKGKVVMTVVKGQIVHSTILPKTDFDSGFGSDFGSDFKQGLKT